MNVASEKFVGWYSNRFKGLTKKKGEGRGFKLPCQEDQEEAAKHITPLSANIFKFRNFTNSDVAYTVDMNIGMCECLEGRNGSVCKHQYVLWSFNITKTANFLPFLNATERQNYAKIAIGSSMTLQLYEGIHDRVNNDIVMFQQLPEISAGYDEDEITNNGSNAPTVEQQLMIGRRSIDKLTVQECKSELRKTVILLEHRLERHCHDSNLLLGVSKLCERAQKYPNLRRSSALHSFGVQTSTSLKVTATSALKKARRGKIYVQPEAVKRRKHTNGSRNSNVKGMRVKNNPFDKEVSTKIPLTSGKMKRFQRRLGER